MKRLDEITIQTLADNADLQIGYSDNDIIIVDSIQQLEEFKTAHITMNVIVICIKGKVQGKVNGRTIELQKNQVAIMPSNIMVTDVMISPDFNMKAMFLTNRILQSFLHDKMNVWNNMIYIHHLHIITMEDNDLLFYTHFYDMLCISVERGKGNPYQTEVIQSLLRSALLGLCGAMYIANSKNKETSSMDIVACNDDTKDPVRAEGASGRHFQQFLNLLHNNSIKHRTVEEYASELCISPKHLTAICKKHSGKTANQWIREQILEEIRYFLKQTDLSIKEICNRIGFPNTSFFGKYVKDHFGMTPMQFRNS